eukprot:TRINITY_DN2265_c0_g1_i2.p1 TRINITY_DN2265_c0_g1~~TRINITY_DN2265_c0_g1_i2.p1  ORF type:complete len:161 (+),score=35.62 TRINITY_DN2265_c0_g1_i2:64-483(+)
MEAALNMWEEEKRLMLSEVLKFWKNAHIKQKFINFWKEESDIKTAILCTAYEDIANGIFGGILEVTCPELVDLSRLMNDTSIVPSLFDTISSAKENIGHEIAQNANLNPIAEKSLKLARSCTLVQFLGAIVLIYKEQCN